MSLSEKERMLPDIARSNSVIAPSINDDLVIPDDHQHQPVKTTKYRVLWNLAVLSVSYFLFFTGFWALSNLQSTMNAVDGMGPDSQAVIYAFSMVSCLRLPEILIEKIGSKRALVMTVFLSCPYIASNLYLNWEFLISASVVFGLVSGPMNTAFAVYINEMVLRFHTSVNESLENISAYFFGFFMFFSESTNVLGNVISYFVLDADKQHLPPLNISTENKCGIDFRQSEVDNHTNSNLNPPTEHERYVLVGSYLAMGLLSVLLIAFVLEPLKNDTKEGTGWRTAYERLLASLRHAKTPQQLLLIPISIYCGIEGSLYANDFTEAYIACSWGVHHVGFVTICFGVCGALTALLVGPLVKCITQMCVLILAACGTIVMCAFLFLWQPSPDVTIIYFIFAGAWGMGDAIWWSQISALYGLMFPQDREAAFSNFYFWSFLGYLLSYSYANYFTVAVKINILLSFLIVGMAGYLAGQWRLKCSARRDYVAIVAAEE